MENQSENNKKTWQEPELNVINILGGAMASTSESFYYHTS